ncbi:DUF6498-containing protein [Bythopirellula goksoeyrii]|uniref:Uncharacterized protein n=1 Tax=Bythopirellula goksoeyrii TaxID=1400387 RepID=A0A5B9QN31_9BACT|nr:DUF6498-containing protein [Bythopirellula goksoeyrii]QEG35531.1 hypothetical protein Pr1d_28320 [Bythopirellula goksoeyrii]
MNSPISKISIREIDFTKPSVLSLIAANMIPLLGVLFLGWSTFAIVVIYWAENVIIGAINVLKMLTCAPTIETMHLANVTEKQLAGNSKAAKKLLAQQSSTMPVAHHASKLFFVPFFIFHYGMFCFVHGVFVFSLLGRADDMPFGGPLELGPHFLKQLWHENLLWAVLALAASHLYSYFTNFLYRGEYRRVTVQQLMFQPYGRIVVMHVAILLGAFLIVALGSPVWMLVILIIGKTLMDVGLHLAEREHNSTIDTSPTVVTT